MDLDRLKKLTKLANHNPNDNEANSAARRVCKMLEEGNFSLNFNSRSEPRVTIASNPSSSNHDWVKDYYTGRSREQRAKYEGWAPGRNSNLEDFFRSMGVDLGEFFRSVDRDEKSGQHNTRGSNDYRCRNCGAYFTTDSKESTIECNICKGEARRL